MTDFAAPRFEEMGPLSIAGISESYTDATSVGIPKQWERFAPYLGKVPGQILGAYYGLEIPGPKPDEWDYVCGVAVSDFSHLLAGFAKFNLPKTKYAVFSHTGYLATIRDTWQHIWTKWLPESKLQITRGARIEKYADTFRPNSPGGLEIWIPLKS